MDRRKRKSLDLLLNDMLTKVQQSNGSDRNEFSSISSTKFIEDLVRTHGDQSERSNAKSRALLSPGKLIGTSDLLGQQRRGSFSSGSTLLTHYNSVFNSTASVKESAVFHSTQSTSGIGDSDLFDSRAWGISSSERNSLDVDVPSVQFKLGVNKKTPQPAYNRIPARSAPKNVAAQKGKHDFNAMFDSLLSPAQLSKKETFESKSFTSSFEAQPSLESRPAGACLPFTLDAMKDRDMYQPIIALRHSSSFASIETSIRQPVASSIRNAEAEFKDTNNDPPMVTSIPASIIAEKDVSICPPVAGSMPQDMNTGVNEVHVDIPQPSGMILSTEGSKKARRRNRRRPNYDPEVKTYVEPEKNDVLLGRGGRTNHHQGNKQYQAAKEEMQPRYLAASKEEKTDISQELVDLVCKTWGGRFLKLEQETGRWYIIKNIAARKKASQTLREINTAELRAAKREKYGLTSRKGH